MIIIFHGSFGLSFEQNLNLHVTFVQYVLLFNSFTLKSIGSRTNLLNEKFVINEEMILISDLTFVYGLKVETDMLD